jgi:Helix-turn-helix domain
MRLPAAARALDVSLSTFRRMMARGLIKGIKLGSSARSPLRFRLVDVVRLIDEHVTE